MSTGFEQAHQIVNLFEEIKLGCFGFGQSFLAILFQQFREPILNRILSILRNLVNPVQLDFVHFDFEK